MSCSEPTPVSQKPGEENSAFAVDACFDHPIARMREIEANSDQFTAFQLFGDPHHKPVYTFEEFLRQTSEEVEDSSDSDSPTNDQQKVSDVWPPANFGQNLEGIRPIDDDNDDGFCDISLYPVKGQNQKTTIPSDIHPPTSSIARFGCAKTRSSSKRSAIYTIGSKNNEPSTSAPMDQDPDFSSIVGTTSLRQAICPTVSSSGGRTTRRKSSLESIPSAAYGYETPEDARHKQKPVSKALQQQMPFEEQRVNLPQSVSNSAVLPPNGNPSQGQRSTLGQIQHSGTTNLPSDQHEQRHKSAIQNAPNEFVSRFFCCFLAARESQENSHDRIGVSAAGPGDQYLAAGVAPNNNNGGERLKYSWEVKELDPKDFCFTDVADDTLIKEPGQIDGQQFTISNCIDSVLILLDHSASITIDDCTNCVIVTGPCKGSVFIRDCMNCWVLSVCQQFRTRDCRNMVAHLFCATAPTIEETDVEISALRLNYAKINEHLRSAGLSPFTNRWNQVHNFTPESGQYKLTSSSSPASPNVSGLIKSAIVTTEVVERFHSLIAGHFPAINTHGLSIQPRDSLLFVPELDKRLKTYEDRVLLLARSLNNSKSATKSIDQFYSESERLMRLILREDASMRLLEMQDFDLKPGEWETVLQLQPKSGGKSFGGKVVAIEVCGLNARISVESVSRTFNTTGGGLNVTVVDEKSTEFYRKQLYRLCEIQQSI